MDTPCSGPPRVPVELEHSLGWLLARAGQQVGAAVAAHLAELGITPRELSVLATAAPQPRPQLGLAIAVGLDKTTMVATVDALERRGLVRREAHADDRRVRLITVTPAGRRLLARAVEVERTVQDAVLATLPEPQRAALVPLLRALVAAAPGGPPTGSCV